MKSVLPALCLLAATLITKAQKVDNIYFHLYTDSLKKGTHNYINVDGQISNNRWLPLTTKEVSFTASAGSFDGNSLYIDSNFSGEKITIKAVLKADTLKFKEMVIYIKKAPDNERLQTAEEVMRVPGKKKRP